VGTVGLCLNFKFRLLYCINKGKNGINKQTNKKKIIIWPINLVHKIIKKVFYYYYYSFPIKLENDFT